MAVTRISSPLGHKLSSTIYAGSVVNSGGDALVNHTDAGIIGTGNWAYIDSNIKRYNGYKYIDVISPTAFKIKNTATGDYIDFIQATDVNISVSILSHTWQSVHLPIVFELESDLYPFNVVEEDATHVDISSFANVNGNTQITTTGAMSHPSELEYIQLSGVGPLAGVYQILDGIDFFNVVIDLAYSAGYDFSPYHVVKYYNNYFVTVEVRTGLAPGHTWEDEKPYELASTLKFIPDRHNHIKFSISEIIKGYIDTRNELTLDTLPNNIDFFTQAQISYYESYDQAEDGEITIFNGEVNDDEFLVNAVNSDMPFKRLYQSFMSDYVYAPTSPGRWLTTMDRPIAFEGYFFDLSFLLVQDLHISLMISKNLNSQTMATETIDIGYPDIGVIRVPIEIESGYDEYCIEITAPIIDQPENNSFDGGMSPWTTDTNYGGGTVEFGYSGNPIVTLTQGQTAKDILQYYSLTAGKTYTFRIRGSVTNTAAFRRLNLYARSVSTGYLTSASNIKSSSGGYDFLFNLSPTQDTNQLFFVWSIPPFDPVSSDIEVFDITLESVSAQSAITQRICIDIVEDCIASFVDDDLRITDGDDLRRLE